MPFSDRLNVSYSDVTEPSDDLKIRFDDPPGPSPARFVGPIFDREKFLEELTRDLGNQATRIQIGGVYSGAHTGESYVIILFVLGGIAGGVLGALGQDIWNAIKKSMGKVLQRNSARRNLVEVALEFEECDIVLRSPGTGTCYIGGL